MNILFYVDHSVASGFGGQERATGNVASALKDQGHVCYYIYRMEYDNDNCSNRDIMFRDKRYVPDITQYDGLLSLLQEWSIDVIIVQGIFDNIGYWNTLIGHMGKICKLIFAYHLRPGVEYDFLNSKYYWSIIKDRNRKRSEKVWASKQILTNNKQWKQNVNKMYREAYNAADNIVVLSSSYIETWKEILGYKDLEHKICAIPNMLSLSYPSINPIPDKEKKVLIVARLSEKEKRISIALKLWRKIEQLEDFDDWNLTIVGEGPDKELYKQYINKHLKRVSLEGYKEPEEFYKESSIFLMTSAAEGWGLTLTEAQQFGCVPIVMNTFSSSKDIINDRENGCLVNYEWQFFGKLKQLMSSSEIREIMANNAMESSHRFEKEKVGKMWTELFNK